MTGEGVGAMEGQQSDEDGEKLWDVRGENDPLSTYYRHADNENDLNEMIRFKRIFFRICGVVERNCAEKVSNFSAPFIVGQLRNDFS